MSEDGGNRFKAQVRRFPMLEAAEERALAQRWREHGDVAARDKLVNSHLRLVAKIARDFHDRDRDELISAGTAGLLQAVERFDPAKANGGRFSTYAEHCIRGAILDFIYATHTMGPNKSSAQRKLFWALPKAKEALRREATENSQLLDGGDMPPDTVKRLAKMLSVSEADIVEMNRRLADDQSLNERVQGDEDDERDGTHLEKQDLLEDEDPIPELSLIERDLIEKHRAALAAVLDEREWRIFEARRLADEPMTLPALGRELDISGERVRQIEAGAIKKLRRVARDTDSVLYSLLERWAKPTRKRKRKTKQVRYKAKKKRDPNWELVVNQRLRTPGAIVLVLEVDAGQGWETLRSVECVRAGKNKHRAFLAGQIARWRDTVLAFTSRNDWTVFFPDPRAQFCFLNKSNEFEVRDHVSRADGQAVYPAWRLLVVERAGPRMPCVDDASLVAALEQQLVAKTIMLPVAFPWHDEEQQLRAKRLFRPFSAAEWDELGISWQWYGEKRRLFRKRKGSKLDVQKRSNTGVLPREWMALYRSQHAFFAAESQQTLEHEMFALAAKSPDAMFELVESPQCNYWTRAQPPGNPGRTTAKEPSTGYEYRFDGEHSRRITGAL